MSWPPATHAWDATNEVCRCGWVWDAATTPAEHVRQGNRPAKACHDCGTALAVGQEAWADDVTVIGPEGARTVTRYYCDGCGAA